MADANEILTSEQIRLQGVYHDTEEADLSMGQQIGRSLIKKSFWGETPLLIIRFKVEIPKGNLEKLTEEADNFLLKNTAGAFYRNEKGHHYMTPRQVLLQIERRAREYYNLLVSPKNVPLPPSIAERVAIMFLEASHFGKKSLHTKELHFTSPVDMSDVIRSVPIVAKMFYEKNVGILSYNKKSQEFVYIRPKR